MTGGVGCGKSEVLAYLENAYGAVILRTDDLAKELMMPGEVCYQDVLALFGPDVLQEDGMLDRVKMAEKVFADEDLLQKLNAVTHPAVLKRTEEIIRGAEEKGAVLICLESALFLDSQGNRIGNEIYRELWYVYADEAARRERLKASRSYSDEKISSIMANQVPESMLRRSCDCVIDNSGDFAETRKQIDVLLKDMPKSGRQPEEP